MKKRHKVFITSGAILFFLSWRFLNSLMDAAQAVGDADLDFDPTLRALVMSSIFLLV